MKKSLLISTSLLAIACLAACGQRGNGSGDDSSSYVIPKSIEEIGVKYTYQFKVHLFMDETYNLLDSFDFSESNLTMKDFEVRIETPWSDEITVSVSDDYIVTPLKLGETLVSINYTDENGVAYQGSQVFNVTSWVNKYYFTREVSLYANLTVRTMAKLYLNEDNTFQFRTWEDWGNKSTLFWCEGTWRKEFPAYLALDYDHVLDSSLDLIPLTTEGLEFKEDMTWFFGPDSKREDNYFAVFGNPYLGNVIGPTIIVVSTTGGGYMHQTRLLTTKEYVTHWDMTGDEW